MTAPDSQFASDPESIDRAARTTWQVSGRAVVVAMFAFGGLLTSALYVYWDLHTRPFRPLQDAIANEFPEFTPRVIGGRHKSQRAVSPNTLRIVLMVNFNPKSQSAASRTEHIAARIADLAATHQDLSKYDILEIHLVHRVPESEDESWSRSGPPAEWGLKSSEGADRTRSGGG
jgi:hypothetical protein